jgi:hypothetical protein
MAWSGPARALETGTFVRGRLDRGTSCRITRGRVRCIDVSRRDGVERRGGYTLRGKLDPDAPHARFENDVVQVELPRGYTQYGLSRDGYLELTGGDVDASVYRDLFAPGISPTLAIAALVADDLRPGLRFRDPELRYLETRPPLRLLIDRTNRMMYVVGIGLVVEKFEDVSELRIGNLLATWRLAVEGSRGKRGVIHVIEQRVVVVPDWGPPGPRRAWREVVAHRRRRVAQNAADLARQIDDTARALASLPPSRLASELSTVRIAIATAEYTARDTLDAIADASDAVPASEPSVAHELATLHTCATAIAATVELAKNAIDGTTRDGAAVAATLLAILATIEPARLGNAPACLPG